MENKALANQKRDQKNWKDIFHRALLLAKIPIVLSFIITPVRFILELYGLPEYTIFIFGLLWLTLAFSVYWGIKLYKEKKAYILLCLSLIIFSPIARLTVVAAWWVDTRWEFNTHYGFYFDNWMQTLLNQVVYGAIVQIIPGFLLGSIVIAVMRSKMATTKQLNNT